MEYKLGNIENLNVEDMIEVTLSNMEVISEMGKELEKLRLSCETSSLGEKGFKKKDEDEIKIILDDEEEEDTLLNSVNYYYARIKDVEVDDDLEVFKRELPSNRSSNYYDIIMGIKVLLLKDINDIKTFIQSEKEIITEEEVEEFNKEVEDIKKKISIIDYVVLSNRIETEINNDDNDVKLNKIVFLETTSGNVYALDDLDNNSVPKEFYEGFYELIYSIQDGTFKNVEFMTSGNNKTAGISKVKGFKKRVIFDRVGYDTYIIIGAFVKKSDKDKSYMEPLKRRTAWYRPNRDKIVDRIKNEEGYLEKQGEILYNLYKLLEEKGRRR